MAPLPGVRIGIWQSLPSAAVSRYLAGMGWDWIILDMQHGPMTFETAYQCIQAIRGAGSLPLVRVGINVPFEVQRALDIGAAGVVVPMVNSLEMARQLAAAAKYPPRGSRSFGSDQPILQGPDYPDRANNETLLLVQVEHIAAVEVVEPMLAIDGVDGCFVGPTDLALSLGLPRIEYATHPRHRAAMERIVNACRTTGKLPCVNTYDIADFGEKVAAGFRGVSLASEVDLLMGSGKALLADLRKTVADHNCR